MKKPILLPFALIALVSCSPKALDPVSESIVAEIMSIDPSIQTVKLKSLEKVDSTTFAQELDRKQVVFETKMKSDEQFMIKYTSENKRKNAALKQQSMLRDAEILRGLDSIRTALGPRLSEVAYYDYVFSAEARSEQGSTIFNESYAAVTKDGRMMGIAGKQKELHRRLGSVIPGYVELVKGDEDASEAQD